MDAQNTSKTKKIIGTVVNVLVWIFVVIAVIVTILAFAAQSSPDGIPELFGKSLITIESDSMKPNFSKGDLIVMTKLDNDQKVDLEVNTIITYRAPIDINGDGNIGDLNTHRIIAVLEDGTYQTQGDNNQTPDGYTVKFADIIGTCEEDAGIPFVGGAIGFLRSSVGFFIFILLPLAVFFIYELCRFIYIVISEKKKDEEEQKAQAPVLDEEEIKRKAVEEYIRQQQEKEENKE